MDSGAVKSDEEVRAVEAIRRTIPCPTCDGSEIGDESQGWYFHGCLEPGSVPHCDDCTDGYISLVRLVEYGASMLKYIEALKRPCPL